MAKGKGKPSVAKADADDKPKLEPIKVSLYDANAVKHGLDDVARDVILNSGYDEELFVSNVKIVLGIAAIGCALYAQFGPGKFPANWWAVLCCVIAYCVVTVALNIFCYYFEGDSFLITKPRRRGQVGLRLSSRMDRYSDKYTLVITADTSSGSPEVKLDTSVAKFYHADGYLAEEAWRIEVDKLLAEYETAAASSAAAASSSPEDKKSQ